MRGKAVRASRSSLPVSETAIRIPRHAPAPSPRQQGWRGGSPGPPALALPTGELALPVRFGGEPQSQACRLVVAPFRKVLELGTYGELRCRPEHRVNVRIYPAHDLGGRPVPRRDRGADLGEPLGAVVEVRLRHLINLVPDRP